jgi:hypothetical protein
MRKSWWMSLVGLGLAVAVSGCLGSYGGSGSGGSGGSGGGGSGGSGGGGGSGGKGGGGGSGGGGSGGSGGGGGSGGSAGSGGGGGGGGSAGAPLGNLLCTATLSITGTYVQGNPPPSDLGGGCWPDGMWTFTATVTDGGGCKSPPTLASQYQVKVVQDDNFDDTITFVTDPSNMYTHLQVDAAGGGLCTGIFTWVSDDGFTIFTMQPSLQSDNSLNGHGQYEMYDADQRN